jgi:hypothetical protein
VKIIANNGKYITVRSNGGLVANGNGSDPTSLFTLEIINRPELILRGQFGFVGKKGKSNRVEVNKSTGSVFQLRSQDGNYTIGYIDDEDGSQLYWALDRDGVHLGSMFGCVAVCLCVQRPPPCSISSSWSAPSF